MHTKNISVFFCLFKCVLNPNAIGNSINFSVKLEEKVCVCVYACPIAELL